MATSHLDRKELKGPDAFQAKAVDVVTFITDNSRIVLAMIVLLFVAGLGFAFYSNHRAHQNELANSALYTARASLSTALEKAPKSATDWEKTAQLPIDEIEKVAKLYRGTEAAFEAQMLLGDTFYERGNPQRAADHYKEALASAGARSLKAIAQHSLAYAYEGLKQYDQAIDALRSVIAANDKTLKADSLLGMARNYELKGDKVRAMEQYDQVIREFPSSAVSRAAEIQKNHLQ